MVSPLGFLKHEGELVITGDDGRERLDRVRHQPIARGKARCFRGDFRPLADAASGKYSKIRVELTIGRGVDSRPA